MVLSADLQVPLPVSVRGTERIFRFHLLWGPPLAASILDEQSPCQVATPMRVGDSKGPGKGISTGKAAEPA